MKRAITAIATLVVIATTLTLPATAQPPADAIENACQAIERMVSQTGDSTLRSFVDNHMTTETVSSMSPDQLLSLLRSIRSAVGEFGGVGLMLRGAGQGRAIFDRQGERVTVDFDVDDTSGRISKIELVSVKKNEPIAPFSWDSAAQRLKKEEENGFSGAVLLFRGDSVILEKGYGLADRENNIPNDSNTIFAIGSTPIDFTNAALLKLEETGKLSTSDPITRFLDNVPEDKQAITLHQLMTGQSGLPDFHGTEEDDDQDLSWIDRPTAIERIMSQDLLFAPGTSQRHSHSAWVLLAAIVEIASDQPYERFLRENFFDKAGMHRTGNYPITKRFKPGEIAVGYGMSQPTEINAPQHWGPTSWLVMGSGGMVSTIGDLYRWHEAMRRGDLLGPTALAKYPLDAAAVGGNDRGFLNCFVYEGDTGFILCSNAHKEMNDQPSKIAQALERLVLQE